MTNIKDRLIRLGVIASAHGIRGEVKIRSFTADPRDVTAYGPLRDQTGKTYDLKITGGTNDMLIATVKGVASRNEAETLRNTELFVLRDALPETKTNEYYHEDLVGLEAIAEDGGTYGAVMAVHNFGAGDLMAIRRPDGEEEMLPFTRQIFPRVDLKEGTIMIVPPDIDAPEAGAPQDDGE